MQVILSKQIIAKWICLWWVRTREKFETAVVSTSLKDNEVVKCGIVRGIIASVIKSRYMLKIQTISHTMLVIYLLIF
jgi:hypothetical protein